MARVVGWALLALAAVPGCLWVAFDRYPFGGDQSQYAAEAVKLFQTLRDSPSAWPWAMVDSMGFKAPGLPWAAQFFVPLGLLLGSVDRGLLLLVTLTQVLALSLTLNSLRQLAAGKLSVVLLGCLVTLSAPLGVRLSHEFMVETLQVLSVAYFVWIAVFAPTSPRGRTLAHLLLAAALALLVKASTPLYCLGFGLVALAYAIALGRRPRPSAWLRPSTGLALGAGVMLAAATVIWYYRHLPAVWRHVLAASSGSVALYWGKDDTPFDALVYWLGALAQGLFVSPGAAAAVALLVAGCVAYAGSRRRAGGHFSVCATVAAVQLAGVLASFSLADNRVQRFLLPCLPSCALLLSWAAAQLRPSLRHIAVSAAAAQFILVHGFAFGLVPCPPLLRDVRVIDRRGQAASVLEALVSHTCYDSAAGTYPVIIAIDAGLKGGDWLAPPPAEYVRAKRQLTGRRGPHCRFEYLGGTFFGAPASEAWDHVMSLGARYLVTTDPEVYPPRSKTYNRALDREQFPLLMARVRKSGLFMPGVRLSEDGGILVFRRADRVSVGRAMSDRGQHRDAVEALRKATALDPQNVEAWANLALACEREGSRDEAMAANLEAWRLKPSHYYVNAGLARGFLARGAWRRAIQHAEYAAEVSPSAAARADALRLAAEGWHGTGDGRRGCRLLQEARRLQPNAPVPQAPWAQHCLMGDRMPASSARSVTP